MAVIHVFRHPRPQGHEGRCIGRTDLRVDPRRARRLARRIRREAARQGWPTVVCTSPLQRARGVGRLLRRWGWRHHVHEALSEADFGHWDGRQWAQIDTAQVDAWVADFARHAPGGGEPLCALFERVAAWQAPVASAVVVGHAGWMLAARWLATHGPGVWPTADQWPRAPAYGDCWSLPWSGATCTSLAASPP
jgi:alpha-ribazole phosphatase